MAEKRVLKDVEDAIAAEKPSPKLKVRETAEKARKAIEKSRDPGKARRDKISAAADKAMAIHNRKGQKPGMTTTLKSVEIKLPEAKKPKAAEEETKVVAGSGAEPATGKGEELPAGRRKEK